MFGDCKHDVVGVHTSFFSCIYISSSYSTTIRIIAITSSSNFDIIELY